jgi:hypothetical protein
MRPIVAQRYKLALGISGPYHNRAGDGIRTHDILLGKQTLCQLSYTRVQATPNNSAQ